jgi:Sulfotransferase family
VPSYDEWFFGQPETESYRHYARVVRLVGAAEPDRRWLLKNPGHINQLGALFEVFPDAMVIHTHRDPLAAIPSLCSTLYMARRIYEGDNTRRAVIGPRECRYWSHALDDAARVRQRHAQQFIDVDHRLFHRDPWAVILEIYEWAGLRLSEEARSRMHARIRAHPSGEHGEHRYDIESWGINETTLRSSFCDYRAAQRFDQPY